MMVRFEVSEEDYITLESYRLWKLSLSRGTVLFSAMRIEAPTHDTAKVLTDIYINNKIIAPTEMWGHHCMIWFLRDNYFLAPRVHRKGPTHSAKGILYFKIEAAS